MTRHLSGFALLFLNIWIISAISQSLAISSGSLLQHDVTLVFSASDLGNNTYSALKTQILTIYGQQKPSYFSQTVSAARHSNSRIAVVAKDRRCCCGRQPVGSWRMRSRPACTHGATFTEVCSRGCVHCDGVLTTGRSVAAARQAQGANSSLGFGEPDEFPGLSAWAFWNFPTLSACPVFN